MFEISAKESICLIYLLLLFNNSRKFKTLCITHSLTLLTEPLFDRLVGKSDKLKSIYFLNKKIFYSILNKRVLLSKNFYYYHY